MKNYVAVYRGAVAVHLAVRGLDERGILHRDRDRDRDLDREPRAATSLK